MAVVPGLAHPSLVACLQQPGTIAVLPTDTVYGVAARASDPLAVQALYRLKRREQKPGTVIAASIQQLTDLGLASSDLARVAAVWPGPVSVVLPAPEALQYLHQGKGSLAVRIPADTALATMLEQTGPLVTSSANQPGEPPAVSIAEAQRYFGNSVPLYVDGGIRQGAASTVIQVLPSGKVVLLREGPVAIDPALFAMPAHPSA